jgi:hypothetical protein
MPSIINNSYLDTNAANGMMRKFHPSNNGHRLDALSLDTKGIGKRKKFSRNDFMQNSNQHSGNNSNNLNSKRSNKHNYY